MSGGERLGEKAQVRVFHWHRRLHAAPQLACGWVLELDVVVAASQAVRVSALRPELLLLVLLPYLTVLPALSELDPHFESAAGFQVENLDGAREAGQGVRCLPRT